MVSLADLIVLGGCAAVEQAAAKKAGHEVRVPFSAGAHRCHARSRPMPRRSPCLSRLADGFRNYLRQRSLELAAEHLLVDKAFMLTLTAPEMTVLLGGMRGAQRKRRAVQARRSSQTAPRRSPTTSS